MSATDTPSAEAIAAQLARLREDYQARLPGELAALSTLASSLDGSDADSARLEELHQRLHKLAGSGGTFGLISLGAQARLLEQQVKQWLTASFNAASDPLWPAFPGHVARLSEFAESSHAGRTHTLPTRTASSAPAQDCHVWLVEDDPGLAEQMCRQLESFGYAVRRFDSIGDAEAAARTNAPDLLIMDILFPQQGENATEVLALRPTLRALGCPLLFVTSNDDFVSRVRAARLGAEGYFLKPLDVPRLINRIAEIFDKRRAPCHRVLIVDDDQELAEHYRLVLTAAEMEAEILHEPSAIIETIASFRPELVLMDLHMPDYSGPELAGVIRQYDRWSSLPIVYLSAETDLDLQTAAMDRGADDFLTKPIADTQLVATVRARIERARQLDAQITRDSLTGLLKHASLKESLEVEVARARRVGKPITVAMLDIDHFKSVNDTYGHAIGDVVISAVAMLLRQRLRQTDILGRYGGEEFVAVLPGCNSEDAYRLLDDIRQRFASVDFSHRGQAFSCTLSVGLATSAHAPQADRGKMLEQLFHDEELLLSADEALYAAKHGGRNQVQVARP